MKRYLLPGKEEKNVERATRAKERERARTRVDDEREREREREADKRAIGEREN